VWDRQKQWELKQEVLFEATRRIAETSDSLTSFGSAVKISRGEDKEKWEETLSKEATRWANANSALDETLMFIQIVCQEDTIEAYKDFRKIAVDFGRKIAAVDLGDLGTLIWLLSLSLSVTRNAIRRELGIPALPTPQSSGSSAAPIPD
jgi:hypothetical protein